MTTESSGELTVARLRHAVTVERCRGDDLGARSANAIDVVDGHGGVQRQRDGAIGDPLGVGQVAAMVAEAAAQRAQVQRLVRDAGGDAALRQRVAERLRA